MISILKLICLFWCSLSWAICPHPVERLTELLDQKIASQGMQIVNQCNPLFGGDSYFKLLPLDLRNLVETYRMAGETFTLQEILIENAAKPDDVRALDLSRMSLCGIELNQEELIPFLDKVRKVFPHVTKISLEGHGVSMAVVDKLHEAYPGLTHLAFAGVNGSVSRENLIKIAKLFPKLKRFTFPETPRNYDEAINTLAENFPFLEGFSFEVSDETLLTFPVQKITPTKFPNLKEFGFSFFDLFMLAKSYPDLTRLNIFTVDDYNIGSLLSFKKLKDLSLRIPVPRPELLPLLEQLESLKVNDLTPAVAKMIQGRLRSLKKLVLGPGSAPLDFSQLPNLEELEVVTCNAECAASLALHCPKLRRLKISSGMTPEQTRAILRGHPEIRRLSLKSSSVDTATLQTMEEKLSRLEILKINSVEDDPDLKRAVDRLSSHVSVFMGLNGNYLSLPEGRPHVPGVWP